MTEDELMTKWCPEIREPYTDQGEDLAIAVNRPNSGYLFNHNCIGSQCSQFRSEELEQFNEDGDYLQEPTIHAWCGKAGKEGS